MPDFKGVQLFTAQTSSLAVTSSENKKFIPNYPSGGLAPGNKPLLLVYGSSFGTCSLILKCKAPDDTFVNVNGITINGFGLYELPVNSNVILGLEYTAGGGSNISACVFQGEEV